MTALPKGSPTTDCGVEGRADGFSLIEVLIAIVVASVGIVGASAIVLGITAEMRRASWNTDHTLAGRAALDSLIQTGFASTVSGSGTAEVRGRQYEVSFDVTSPSQRLRHVRLTAGLPNGPRIVLETRLSRPRPLPPAP